MEELLFKGEVEAEEEEEVEAPRLRSEEERLEEEEEEEADLERRRSAESIRREGVVEGNWESRPGRRQKDQKKWWHSVISKG